MSTVANVPPCPCCDHGGFTHEPCASRAVIDTYRAEADRLRAAIREAIEGLDSVPEDPKRFARVAGITIPMVRGGLAMALLPIGVAGKDGNGSQ